MPPNTSTLLARIDNIQNLWTRLLSSNLSLPDVTAVLPWLSGSQWDHDFLSGLNTAVQMQWDPERLLSSGGADFLSAMIGALPYFVTPEFSASVHQYQAVLEQITDRLGQLVNSKFLQKPCRFEHYWLWLLLICTVKPVLSDHCKERPPIMKDQIFLAKITTFRYKWICHQRPPV